jgi:hypothetical protein
MHIYLKKKKGITRTKVKTYSLDKGVSFYQIIKYFLIIEFGTVNKGYNDEQELLDKTVLTGPAKHQTLPS